MLGRGKHAVQVSIFRAVALLFALFFGVSLLGGQAPSALVGPAAARSCQSPARFEVYPSNGEAAPRNTRVVVVAEPSHGMPGWESPPRIALRTDVNGSAEIPSTTEQTKLEDLTTIVLSPRALLDPNRAYSVSAGNDPIAHFRTSAEIDREPPRWAGVSEISAQWWQLHDHTYGWASLLVEPAVNPGNPTSPVAYVLFVEQSKSTFLYLRPHANRLLLDGARIDCGEPNIDWRGDRFDVTIRAVDMAGNFSAPRHYRIDVGVDGVSHPWKWPPPTIIAAGALFVVLTGFALHRYRRARARRQAAYSL